MRVGRSAGSETSTGSIRPLGRGLYKGRTRYTLRLLREAVGATQSAIARDAAMYQSDVSKLEGKASLDDVQISTLRRYAQAIGGNVEIAIVLNGRRYVLVDG